MKFKTNKYLRKREKLSLLKGIWMFLCQAMKYVSNLKSHPAPFNLDLECFQGWGIYHFSGQPIAVFHHFVFNC